MAELNSTTNPLENKNWSEDKHLKTVKLLPYLTAGNINKLPIQIQNTFNNTDTTISRGAAYIILEDWFNR